MYYRLFLKLENINYLLTQNTDFVSRGYPHGDFLIRFGLVWNFFL
ncbi:putative porin [Zunongwangia sp.]